jgi:hypothetical protein
LTGDVLTGQTKYLTSIQNETAFRDTRLRNFMDESENAEGIQLTNVPVAPTPNND